MCANKRLKVLASSQSFEGINKLVNEYFCSIKKLVPIGTKKRPRWAIQSQDGAGCIHENAMSIIYRNKRFVFVERG